MLVTIVLSLLLCSLAGSQSLNVTNISPSCGPVNAYTIISISGNGFSNTSYVIFGSDTLLPDNIVSQSDEEIVFVAYIKDSSAQWALICDNNICEDAPVPFTPYTLPTILLDITTNATTASITAKNAVDCGATKVRVSSSSSIQEVDAQVIKNTTTTIVFDISGKTLVGAVTVALDGQHFDSLSAKTITLNVNGGGSSGSNSGNNDGTGENGGGGGGDEKHEANRTWLWILLAVVGALAFVFLIYIGYRLKNRDDDGYSKLGW